VIPRLCWMIVLVFLLGSAGAFAQSSSPPPAPDTVHTGGVDTVVVFNARDSVHFSISKKRMRLRGDADVKFHSQRLQAEVIIMDFGPSTLTAEGAPDSTGRITGFPIFTDNGEQYASESILYNFKTRRGLVRFGETSIDGGYYYGTHIKRVSEDVAYIENGHFTTCDAPHPHFYFNSPKMKVMVNDKIFMDPVIAYIEDIPVFILPVGLFFSAERGRRSGLIVPTPRMTSDRGIVLEQLGYYWAASDYFDTELTADITTKGGIVFTNRSRYNVRDVLSGRLELRYGNTRFNVDNPYKPNFGLFFIHNQNFRPNESLVMDLTFTSENLFQNTSLNIGDRIKQNARSNASYQRTFYNGHTFNIGYTRDQNISNSSVTHVPTISYSIPQFFPLRDVIGGDHWLRDLSLTYRTTGRYSYSAQRSADTLPFAVSENSLIEHRPSLTVTPKLGNITLQPSISYSENWYFQRYAQQVNAADSTIVQTREQGFFREFTYRAGVSASTFLYGMANPRIFGITALRHTLQPTIDLSFSPDLSDPGLGFFGQYVSPVTGKTIKYSRFGSGIASSREQFLVTMGLLNKLSIKTKQDDTLPDKALDLLIFNVNTSYNIAADSLKLSPISLTVRSPLLDAIAFNSTFGFSIYDQALGTDPATGRLGYQTINRTLAEAGKGFLRLTNATLNIGTRFSSGGLSFTPRSTETDTTAADSSNGDLRSRFDRRLNYKAQDDDIFGERTPGYSPVIMPWDAEVNLAYTYNRTDPVTSFESLLLSVRGNLSLTETLRMSASSSFDLVSGAINTPVIDITKRIHCWNLSFNWVPSGFNRGFYLRFSADAAMLRDLQITKQNTPLYR